MPASDRAASTDGPLQAGIGLRQPHVSQLMRETPRLGFVEVHSENFFGDGGAALATLEAARACYPVSLHGVGLGLGSAAGLDPWHLERLARLVRRVDPARVSDHACFCRAPLSVGATPAHANDLLPVAFTPGSLDILCANVATVQDRLGRPLLVENLSAYLSFRDDSIPEPEFFAALCRRSGCGMLLDVNNLMVNALNAGAADPAAHCMAYVDALPVGIVGEIHLAGHAEVDGLVIDDHGSRVAASVWAVYAHALERFGAVPTLVEWDTDLPALAVLIDEAERATRMLGSLRAAAGPGGFAGFGSTGRAAVTTPAWADEATQQRRLMARLFTSADETAISGIDADICGLAAAGVTRAAVTQHAAVTETAAVTRARGDAGASAPAPDAVTLRGLQAYRANAEATAARASAVAFPTVQALVGAANARHLAVEFWRAAPPCRGDLGEWGDGFAGWLGEHPAWIGWPYLADCARLDFALHRSERAEDNRLDATSIERLGDTDPSRLVLLPAAHLALVESAWPIGTIFLAHASATPGSDAELARFETARVAIAARRGEAVQVARDGWRAVPTAVDAVSATWLRQLLAGSDLGAALEAAGDGFDFSGWLATALASGWLAGIRVRSD